VHFGHRTQKWDPRMKPYIFTERNGIHIIDLQQTAKSLEDAYNRVRDLVARGGTVLFVGTKRQAQETIETEAQRAGMPYVTVRWLGGMLTNWQTMRQRISELDRLERQGQEPQTSGLTKKELLSNSRVADKLEERFGGIRSMTRQPDMLFVVDVNREETAVREANILGIPVLGLVDTNCNPTVIDYVIPSNDDAIRAIKLMVAYIADAVIEGRSLHTDKQEGEVEKPAPSTRRRKADAEAPAEELSDEDLLGAATLAKVAEEQAKEEAEAAAKAAKEAEKAAKAAEAAEAAETVEAGEATVEAATEEAAPKKEKEVKAKKPRTKVKKSDLQGDGEEQDS
ncbi:MAG: 30S ribosomal protein S2, partial [Anaerolineales bacterium]|nr:30S ribosomal protein S2 [Anaerolineales bacterium]